MSRFEPLPREFYQRSALQLARLCIGQLLVSELHGELLVSRIVEAEAYAGVRDSACHGFGGRRTARNESMFGPPGHAYVFLIYGLHFHLNLVAAKESDPSAVLLRAVEPIVGEAPMRARRRYPKDRRIVTNGPGKLCQAYGIDRSVDGIDLCHPPLYLAQGTRPRHIGRSPRIGIDYAGDWAKKPYRFFDASSSFVSSMR